MKLWTIVAGAGLVWMLSGAAAFAETENCTNITTLPATISSPGVYCMKQNLGTGITTGAAITVNANNVTIDFNDFRLGGGSAGPATQAIGVYAQDRQNITLRNGNIRGFFNGITIAETPGSGSSSGHLIENNVVDGSSEIGIRVDGSGIVVQRNRIVNTDSTPPAGGSSGVAGLSGASDSGTGRRLKGSGLSNGVVPQAGTGTSINALRGQNLRNSLIADNLISNNISSAGEAYAIFLDVPFGVEVTRNTILETRAASYATGVFIQSAPTGSVVVVKDNVIARGVAATNTGIGIEANGADVLICLDNVISSFTTGATLNCTTEQGTIPAAP